MAKLDQLEIEVTKAQEHIDRLQVKKSEALQAVSNDPDNDKAALTAAAAEMQVRAAENAKAQAIQAVQDERRRLHDQQVDQAREKLLDLQKQCQAIQEKHTAAALQFFTDFEKWQAIMSEHDSLAQRYGLKGQDIRNQDLITGGMIVLNKALQNWKIQKELVDYRRRHHGG